jgi:hypothetical protein
VLEIYTGINCFLLISKQQHVCPDVTDGQSKFHTKEVLDALPPESPRWFPYFGVAVGLCGSRILVALPAAA